MEKLGWTVVEKLRENMEDAAMTVTTSEGTFSLHRILLASFCRSPRAGKGASLGLRQGRPRGSLGRAHCSVEACYASEEDSHHLYAK